MNPTINDFTNKVILITGSSRGIGQSLALNFGKLKAIVIINYLNSKKEAEKTAKKIIQSGGQSIIIKTDISNQKNVFKMARKIIQKYGRIDILINNAGAIIQPIQWNQITPKSWQKTIDINLTGTFNCIQAFAPLMLKQKTGNIINISSLRGILGAKDIIAYSAAKAGIDNLTKSFAKIFGSDININTISLGRINAGMGLITPSEKIKNNKIGNTEDVFNAVLFLANPKSNFITGQTLIVDGGSSLN